MKIPKWQHDHARYYKRGKLVFYFLSNAAKTCLYGLKILENIEIDYFFQSRAFFHLYSNPHTSYFSAFKEFRDYQINCFESLWNNFDSFVCQPTGSAKLIKFQILPFLSFARENPGVTKETLLKTCHYKALIISPLLSLMHDQLTALKNIGVRPGCLSNNKEDQKLLEVR